jgi:uncharacterized protein (DUF58 family)
VNSSQFLDPQVLARIDNLELLARTVVDGFINGLHHSPYFGLSVDFAEHRQYMPGDDIRRVDWRVFGRTDRFYVKEYEADTNANFSVLFDISKSMDYGSKGITKLDYGRYLAACLSYFSRTQRDRVGMLAFDSDVREYVPSSAKHLDIVLHAIDNIKASDVGSFSGPINRIAEMLTRRSILVLISDLYEDPDVVVDSLNLLRHKGNDVIVFHLLDHAEIEFPFESAAYFQDIESGESIPVVPETLRDQYLELMNEHVTTLEQRLVRSRIDYARFDTSQPLDFALFEYLARRQRMSRVR